MKIGTLNNRKKPRNHYNEKTSHQGNIEIKLPPSHASYLGQRINRQVLPALVSTSTIGGMHDYVVTTYRNVVIVPKQTDQHLNYVIYLLQNNSIVIWNNIYQTKRK